MKKKKKRQIHRAMGVLILQCLLTGTSALHGQGNKHGHDKNPWPYFEKVRRVQTDSNSNPLASISRVSFSLDQQYVLGTTVRENSSILVYRLTRNEKDYDISTEPVCIVNRDILGDPLAFVLPIQLTKSEKDEDTWVYVGSQGHYETIISGYQLHENGTLSHISGAMVKGFGTHIDIVQDLAINENTLFFAHNIHFQNNTIVMMLKSLTINHDGSLSPVKSSLVVPQPDGRAQMLRMIQYDPGSQQLFATITSFLKSDNQKVLLVGYGVDENGQLTSAIQSMGENSTPFVNYIDSYLAISQVHREIVIAVANGARTYFNVYDISNTSQGLMPERIQTQYSDLGTEGVRFPILHDNDRRLFLPVEDASVVNGNQYRGVIITFEVDSNGNLRKMIGNPHVSTSVVIQHLTAIPGGCHIALAESALKGIDTVAPSALTLYRINDPDPNSSCYRAPPTEAPYIRTMEVGLPLAGALLTTMACLTGMIIYHFLKKRGRRLGYQPLESMN